MSDCREIIERLEKLGGEVDETRRAWLAQNLSCDIHAELLNPIPKGYHRVSSSGRYLMASNRRGMSWSESVPDYTASLDAAVALVEKMLPEQVVEIFKQALDGWCSDLAPAKAADFPRYVLLALFRALEQKP